MLTISQVAKRFEISRSTLLYYDRIGLLSPSTRSNSNYRFYSKADLKKMELIALYRQAGLPLKDIARILTSKRTGFMEVFNQRLCQLNEEIHVLRKQQRLIIKLMKTKVRLCDARCLDKNQWVAILRAAGMSNQDMCRWHTEFERLAPEAHQDFLEALGIADVDIIRIREWSAGRSDAERTEPV